MRWHELRSAVVKELEIKKKSQRRKRTPNTMAEGEEGKGLERAEFLRRDDETREDISKLRSEVRGLQAEINGTKEEVSTAQQRISEVESRKISGGGGGHGEFPKEIYIRETADTRGGN